MNLCMIDCIVISNKRMQGNFKAEFFQRTYHRERSGASIQRCSGMVLYWRQSPVGSSYWRHCNLGTLTHPYLTGGCLNWLSVFCIRHPEILAYVSVSKTYSRNNCVRLFLINDVKYKNRCSLWFSVKIRIGPEKIQKR